MSGWFYHYHVFAEIFEFNANRVDPDLTPYSVASDLDLHCLLMSLLWDARLKWVKCFVEEVREGYLMIFLRYFSWFP